MKKPGLGVTSQTVLRVSWSWISTPVALTRRVTTPMVAAIRPVRGRALAAATSACTAAAASDPMKRPSTRWISPWAASAPKAQPESATTRISSGARENSDR